MRRQAAANAASATRDAVDGERPTDQEQEQVQGPEPDADVGAVQGLNGQAAEGNGQGGEI